MYMLSFKKNENLCQNMKYLHKNKIEQYNIIINDNLSFFFSITSLIHHHIHKNSLKIWAHVIEFITSPCDSMELSRLKHL